MEIKAVILSAAKDLASRTPRSFAALRMTARIPLKFARGKLISKCLGEVVDITDSEYFQQLHSKADELRRRVKTEE